MSLETVYAPRVSLPKAADVVNDGSVQVALPAEVGGGATGVEAGAEALGEGLGWVEADGDGPGEEADGGAAARQHDGGRGGGPAHPSRRRLPIPGERPMPSLARPPVGAVAVLIQPRVGIELVPIRPRVAAEVDSIRSRVSVRLGRYRAPAGEVLERWMCRPKE
jgi:hypothetical protein